MYEVSVEILFDDDFRKDVLKLSSRVQEKLADLLMIAEGNIFDPRLHTKRLKPPLSNFFSFRIIRDYRVGFIFITSNQVRLLTADNRDQIYKKLLRKI